jgi:hypothetical protein
VYQASHSWSDAELPAFSIDSWHGKECAKSLSNGQVALLQHVEITQAVVLNGRFVTNRYVP